jgi:hypothetical protein
VNEFFPEIARTQKISWRDRKHFLAVASQAMRRFPLTMRGPTGPHSAAAELPGCNWPIRIL